MVHSTFRMSSCDKANTNRFVVVVGGANQLKSENIASDLH